MRLLPRQQRLVAAIPLLAALGGCAGVDGFGTTPTAAVAPAIPAQAVIGRWGLGSYHREEDRARTEAAARAACAKPYEIAPGPTGGVIMHLADEPQPRELVLKGAQGGRTFVGPPGQPADPQDREIVSNDGNVMIMRWVNPEVASRYGTLVFAKCTLPPVTPARR